MFGSNVIPRKFGRGSETQKAWDCICGRNNKPYMVRCEDCDLEKNLARVVSEKLIEKIEDEDS